MKKLEFERLGEVFGERLFKALLWDEFSQDWIERMLDACRTIRFARSNNRSVLGSMNDLRFQIEVYVAHDGGLVNTDLAKLHHKLNRIPMGAIGHRYAVEGLREWLAQA